VFIKSLIKANFAVTVKNPLMQLNPQEWLCLQNIEVPLMKFLNLLDSLSGSLAMLDDREA